MEEIVFSLKHHWRFLNAKNLELHGLSLGPRPGGRMNARHVHEAEKSESK